MIRFDRELLGRVDVAAKRRGISRNAWVQYTISRALDTGEG
jgi:predicted HicB family RNase H-like nuclease